MTTSGTTAFQNSFDILTVIEEAYELVGIESRTGYDLKTARRSLDLLMKEWANRGTNLWTIAASTESVSASATTITLDSDTVDVIDAVWRTGSGTSQQDRALVRIGVSEYADLVNKNQTGVPTQYWINRTATPTAYIWPVPSEAGTFAYWKMRRMEDTGAYTNTMDVPANFLPAMTHGLAFYLAMKTPSAEGRIPMLKAEYDRQYMFAAEEDRERASSYFVPDVR